MMSTTTPPLLPGLTDVRLSDSLQCQSASFSLNLRIPRHHHQPQAVRQGRVLCPLFYYFIVIFSPCGYLTLRIRSAAAHRHRTYEPGVQSRRGPSLTPPAGAFFSPLNCCLRVQYSPLAIHSTTSTTWASTCLCVPPKAAGLVGPSNQGARPSCQNEPHPTHEGMTARRGEGDQRQVLVPLSQGISGLPAHGYRCEQEACLPDSGELTRLCGMTGPLAYGWLANLQAACACLHG